MILQALTRYYDILANDPEITIARQGYSTVGVSFALDLSEEGGLLDIVPQYQQEQRGKKSIEVPRSLILPAAVKRSGTNPAPNFLWDNAAFVLGISDKAAASPAYAHSRFHTFRRKQQAILNGVDSSAARSILNFLDKHDPATARTHPVITRHLEALLKGGNLIFRVNGVFAHNDPAIRSAWDAQRATQGAAQAQCLVTGVIAPIARLHTNLKRVRGAQAMGVPLVGFNKPAFNSYNRAQGMNAPVSEAATFAYTTVLNHLLSDANPNPKFHLGDATVVYWAESENRAYEQAYASIIDPPPVEVDEDSSAARTRAEKAMGDVAKKVRRAQALNLEALLEPLKEDNPRFYVLGLAPNAGRASVRFFVSEPFTDVVANIMTHYRDLEIVKEFSTNPTYITISQLLSETVSKNAKDKNASPLLSGAVLRAILTNQPYPAALYYAILNRVRADMDNPKKHISKVNYMRAAVIKAYLLRKYRSLFQNPFKEVLTMALNEDCTIPAYLLGRLFAVLEKLQIEAIPGINSTIKDRFFTSACASPRSAFPTLLRLSTHHIAKSDNGKYWDRQIQGIVNMLDVANNPIPSRLTLDEQGVFILGYYHQRAAIYTPRVAAPAA